MGDSIDGSSNAAQRARSMTPDPAPRSAVRLVETEIPVTPAAKTPADVRTSHATGPLRGPSVIGAPVNGSPANGIQPNGQQAAALATGSARQMAAAQGSNGGPAQAGGGTPASAPGTTGALPPSVPAAQPAAPAAAATGSTPSTDSPHRHGFLRRLLGGARRHEGEAQAAATGVPEPKNHRRHSLLNLRNMRVEDVAIPKVEIVAVPNTISQDDLVDVFRESGMTRLPVYEETLDRPKGFVHLKDFALKHGWNTTTEFSLNDLLRPLLFVPPSMPIGVLLQKMQTERRHMALVIDEYGGVDGLVTIEDLIEQVIGEIEDEHDVEEDALWTREASGSYLALAKAPLEDFEAAIGRSLTEDDSVDEEEIDTLGGLVFMLAGRVPARGEVVKHPAGHEFEVIDADPRRIKRLRVRLAEPEQE